MSTPDVSSWNAYYFLALAGIACMLSGIITLCLRRWASRLGLVDIPNERSSHRIPTPRGGGLAFVFVALAMTATAFCLLGIYVTPAMWALLAGSLIVSAVSLTDDLKRIPILVRFCAHAAGALILIAGGGWIHEVEIPSGAVLSLGALGLPLTFIWVVGLTNAYNFMDGIDGLAAGHAIVASTTIAWLAHLRGADTVGLTMVIMGGAVLGFLLHNWPPAKIFMGDVGSAFLGFTFAGWAVLTSSVYSKPLPFLAWALVMAPFILDTVVTLVSRIVRRKRWYEAHCEHLYQRLNRLGWSHKTVTCLYLAITALLGLAIILFYGYQKITSSVFIGMITFPLAGILLIVSMVEASSNQQHTHKH